MDSTNAAQKFELLAAFLCEFGQSIFETPINGELKMLHVVFSIYERQRSREMAGRYELEQFVSFLLEFDSATGIALEFDENSNLKGINLAKIELFRKKLQNADDTEKNVDVGLRVAKLSGSKKDQLLKLLEPEPEAQLDLQIRLLEPLVHFSNKTAKEFVDYESACVVLNKQRAKFRVPKMPFSEVCNNANHNKVLSNVCFSRKDFHNGSKQTFPSLDQCLNAIEQFKKLISPEVYQCSKNKIHYLPIITNFTDISLGDCSYLDTCHKMRTCRYLHYFSLYPKAAGAKQKEVDRKLYDTDYTIGFCFTEHARSVLPPQWINCDVRYLPFAVLGKFAVILSDPAWDIHMALPYGTCRDLELLSLPMHELQDEGVMLLWVTGRSIDVGRQALSKWGYKVSDEMIWVKLNQLKRTIVTGRTGHWLNHSKEHLLVGVKGNPEWLTRSIDVNVVVSGTRETSRKPDEIYGIVDRLVGPYARKLEFFGRDHNVRPGWLTIGNQLAGSSLYEKDVKERYEAYQKASN